MLANLGIQGGWSCPSVKLAGNVFLLTSNLASYANPEEAIPLASRALADIGNVRKLRESGHDRRHLFVWIDLTVFPAWEGICSGSLPHSSLDLPDEVTDLWLGARCFGGECNIYRYTRDSGWKAEMIERVAD